MLSTTLQRRPRRLTYLDGMALVTLVRWPRDASADRPADLAGPDSLPRELLLTILEMMHEEGQGGYDAGVTEVMAYRTALRRAALAYETWADPAAELLRSICCVGDSIWDGTRWTAHIETEDGADPESVRIVAIGRGAALPAMPALPFAGNVVHFVGPMDALALLSRWPRLTSAAVLATDAEGPTALANAPNLRRLKLDGASVGRTEDVTLSSVREFTYHASMGQRGLDVGSILALMPHLTTLAMSGVTIHAACRSLTGPADADVAATSSAPSSRPWLGTLLILDISTIPNHARLLDLPADLNVGAAFASLPSLRAITYHGEPDSSDDARQFVTALTTILFNRARLPVLERVEVVGWRKRDTPSIFKLRAICRIRGITFHVSYVPGARARRTGSS